MNLDNKSILILGFGREGMAMLNFISQYVKPKSVTVADRNLNIDSSKYNGVNFVLGEDYDKSLDEYDIVIKSPGIKLSGHVTSQTALFLDLFSSKTVGITGTKGKSTTSALIHHIMMQSNPSSLLLGNMGIAAFSKYEEAISASSIVYEMSSHQLLDITKAPHIAVLLNFYQEHLDYYDSYENYMQAKCNIFRKQSKDDILIYNADDMLVVDHIRDCTSKLYAFSLSKHSKDGCYLADNRIVFVNHGKEEVIINDICSVSLKGRHNLLNIMAAIIASKLSGASNEDIQVSIHTFKSLPHRLEFVGDVDGVEFYNDSIATIPEATIQAIEALRKVDTLILGGYDRGIDYDNLVEYLSKLTTLSNLILTGDAGKRMLCLFSKYTPENKNIMWFDNYDDIVDFAKRVTQRGKICLLSPAAASYDAFTNFEERGERFKELISK